MTDPRVHLNGSLVPASEAAVSVNDAGFLHGASTFTAMLARNGSVFRLDQHLRRVRETVEMLRLQVDFDAAALRRAVDEVLDANELTDARVRLTLTPGALIAGEHQPTTLVTAEPLPDYPDEWYTQGLPVVVSSFTQHVGDPTFGYKTGCYFPRLLARQEAQAKGAIEALWFTHDNRLAEACFCNVFLVQEGKVRTPPRDTPVLPGIVRGAALELCESLGVEASEHEPLTVHEMLAGEEIFLTSSCSGIRPVRRVEKHTVGRGEPGEVTRRIMDAYAELLDRECS